MTFRLEKQDGDTDSRKFRHRKLAHNQLLFYLFTGVLPIVYYTYYIIVILASFQSISDIFLYEYQ
jgi:hypothetical protein